MLVRSRAPGAAVQQELGWYRGNLSVPYLGDGFFLYKNSLKERGRFKMRSDVVKKGITRTAHRSLFHAMGYTDEELEKPLIGVVNAFNEIIPGHIHLREIAQAVKMGVAEAGGTPIEFPAIGICDGIVTYRLRCFFHEHHDRLVTEPSFDKLAAAGS